MEKEIKYELPERTAKRFTHVHGAPPVFRHPKHGDIDIRTLTPEKAKALIESGCKHIAEKSPDKAAKAEETK